MKLPSLPILSAALAMATASSSAHSNKTIHPDSDIGFEAVADNLAFDAGVIDIRSFIRGTVAFNASKHLVDHNDSLGVEMPYHDHEDEDFDVTEDIFDDEDDLDDDDDDEGDDFEFIEVDPIDGLTGRRLRTTPTYVVDKMTNRDKKWLNSHNNRRKKYHLKYGSSYSPLMWSHKLKRKVRLINLCRHSFEPTSMLTDESQIISPKSGPNISHHCVEPRAYITIHVRFLLSYLVYSEITTQMT